MNRPTALRRLLLAPPGVRGSLVPFQRPLTVAFPRYYAAPSIVQRDFWANMIPKPFRKTSPTNALKRTVKSKEWNPATFFIIIFLFIGSMAMQMISLRMENAAFTRRADARIGLLREIIEKIQKGEEVDVEGLLGTGDKKMEEEWEEVLREIEQEDEAWERSRNKKPNHRSNLEMEETSETSNAVKSEKKEAKPKSKAPAGFY